MKKNRILLNILHFIVTIGFWGTLCFGVLNLGFDLFTKNGYAGNFQVRNHHAVGYSVPFSLRISIPDSIVKFRNNNMNGTVNYYHNFNDHNHRTDSILQLPSTVKSVIKTEIRTYPNKLLINPEINADGFVLIKSPKLHIHLLQMGKSYLNILFLIFTFYQLMIIFKQLLRNFSFTQNISKRVNYLGLLLISFELFTLLLTIIISSEIGAVIISSTKNNEHLDEAMKLYINPQFDFDITIFIVGLSLLILSSLLKMGSKLEQENNLTI